MTLDKLTENDSGIITLINDKKLADQLFSLGFMIGEEVKIERIAPLNDPMLITAGLNYISIRKSDAINVEIKKL